MSEAWDKVNAAAQALKDALDKAAHTSPADAAHGASELTKHIITTTHRNIDRAVDWMKKETGQD